MLKALKEKIKKRIIFEKSGLLSAEEPDREKVRETVLRVMEEIIRYEHLNLSAQDKEIIVNEIINEITGFGPIENILKDPYVTEIMINGPKKIYLQKHGRIELSDVTFDDEEQLMYLIYKLTAPTRRRVDESNPYTEISLKDGSRVNIVIPPIALDGPIITIRKFLKEIRTVEDLIRLGTLDQRMSDFLIAAIRAKLNIIFSGATGVGKTTTLNVLSSYISDDERIVTIEDTAELNLSQSHVVRLEAKQPNIEGRGEISIRKLFKNSLRMRPDRIILGEIRGGEALDMLQAICSGHSGSLVVIHASSPEDVISRLETMILTSGLPISVEVIRRQISSSIHLVVQQELLLDGSRKITHLAQVDGLKDNQVVLEDIFVYDIENVFSDGKIKGRWRATGVKPAFSQLFKKAGISLPEQIFKKD